MDEPRAFFCLDEDKNDKEIVGGGSWRGVG